MAFRINAPTAAVAGALLVAGLAACSGSEGLADKPADEIGRVAVEAMRNATSLTMQGDITAPTGGTSRLKLSVSRQGECAGTIEAAKPPTQVRILVAGGASYMKPDRRYLEANAGGPEKAKVTEEKIAGRWLKLDARSGADEFKGLCDLGELLSGLDAKTAGSKAVKGRRALIDGIPAVAIRDREGKRTTTAWVAVQGRPYILRLDSRDGADTGTIAFSGFDRAARPKPPAAGEFVDMAKLNG